MDNTTNLTDALMYFIPGLLVLMAVFMLVKRFLDRDYKLRLLDAKVAMQKNSMPIKLQAYERMVLFLERISPNHLLVRTHRAGVTASQLHADLLATIRAEFEHNLSQQIYVSSEAWEMVKNAKEDSLKQLNNAYALAGQNGTGMQLSSLVIDQVIKNENFPTQKAIDFLKAEAKQLLE